MVQDRHYYCLAKDSITLISYNFNDEEVTLIFKNLKAFWCDNDKGSSYLILYEKLDKSNCINYDEINPINNYDNSSNKDYFYKDF